MQPECSCSVGQDSPLSRLSATGTAKQQRCQLLWGGLDC